MNHHIVKAENIFTNMAFPLYVQALAQKHLEHHSHDFVEVVYVAQGTAEHTIHTVATSQQAKVAINDSIAAGDIFVIATGEQHAYQHTKNLRIFNILFMPELIEDCFADIQDIPGIFDFFVVEPCFRTETQFRSKLRLPPPTREHVETCLNRLAYELDAKAPGYKAAAKGLFLDLLVTVGRANTPTAYTLDMQGKRSAIQKAIAFIRQNYADALSLNTISDHVFLSPHYFSERFKSETGLSPWEYLTTVRLEQAKSLLVHTDASITDIAQSVGFGDSSYFSKVFKTKEGLSPRTFRKQAGTNSRNT